MDSFSLDDARAVLMGEDILPLSIDAPSENEEPDDETGSQDSHEVIQYESLQAAENAAFEATLDAAFGEMSEPSVRQEFEAGFHDAVRTDDEDVDQANSFNNGMVGLGVDIVEIERMQSILRRSPSFASKVFSLQEQLYCDSRSNPAAHYAVRFAAKEAVVKALGTGFSKGIGVRDIEVERMKSGRPAVKLTGSALRIAQEQGVVDISLSMSYTKTDAVACVMALTRSAVRASEKRKDPKKELARQFKETRKILDEL